jgi:hypothetical protein
MKDIIATASTCITILLFSLTTPANAAKQLGKDATALQNVQQAIAAMGGPALVGSIFDEVAKGQILPAPGSKVQGGAFTWTTAGQEFRYEAAHHSGDTSVLASGHGFPANAINNDVGALPYHVIYGAVPVHLPAVVLYMQSVNPGIAMTFLGSGMDQGRPVLLLQTSLTSNDAVAAVSQQTWYLDSTSFLPLRLDYRIPTVEDMGTWTNATVEFGNYQPESGMLCPTSLTYLEEGVELNTLTISEFDFNTGVDQSLFDLGGN